MKQKLNTRWCSVELDDAEPRKRFRRALMKAASEFSRHQRCTDSILTPYWDSCFIDWLIYDCTLTPVGCICTEKTSEHCVFEVNSAGCQSEGICLNAIFDIPTKEFTRRQLEKIVPGCGEYYPRKVINVKERGKKSFYVTYGPFDEKKYIRFCEWWYDGFYDDAGEEEDE